jgi:cell division protease FtsH
MHNSDTPPQDHRFQAEEPDDSAAKKKRKAAPGETEQKGSNRSGLFLILAIIFIVIFLVMMGSPWEAGAIPYSYFIEQVESGNVTSVKFNGDRVQGEWKEIPKKPPVEKMEMTEKFHTVMDARLDHGTLQQMLREKGVQFDYSDTSVGLGTQMMIWMLGLILTMVIFVTIMRRSSDPMGQGMFGNFVRSPARLFRPADQKTTFDDVAGMEQPKQELQEIVEFLKNPAKFQRLGAEIPKGVLMMGSPGTGKTLLARATAGEADVPFFTVNGSEFIQMFVGVGASRVRDLFKTAKEASPCLIFIDEIDAVGRVRGAGMGGGHDEREQTLNQILSEMDGFSKNEAVIVIAATNRPDVLDKALTRPGRFDRHITVDLPSKEGRLGILKVHSRKVPLAPDVKLDVLAGQTIGFSGAELKNLVNEAALHASRTSSSIVAEKDFEAAFDRILMGTKREEVLSDREKRMTAYHEAGHAIVAWLLPELDPVHKVTIVPRGRALGVTWLQPKEERLNYGEKRLKSQLAMMLGGRAAEKLVFDEYTAGAQDDLKKSTDLARRMVAFWGMSETIGPVAFHHANEDPFLGRDYTEQRDFSDSTAHIIDQEIQKILHDASRKAVELLSEHRDKLDKLTSELMSREVVDTAHLTELFGERPPMIDIDTV